MDEDKSFITYFGLEWRQIPQIQIAWLPPCSINQFSAAGLAMNMFAIWTLFGCDREGVYV